MSELKLRKSLTVQLVSAHILPTDPNRYPHYAALVSTRMVLVVGTVAAFRANE